MSRLRRGLSRDATAHAAWWLLVCGLYLVLDQGAQREPDRLALLERALIWSASGYCISAALWALYLKRTEGTRAEALVLAFVGGVAGGFLHFAVFQTADWIFVIEAGFVSPLKWPPEVLAKELTTYLYPMLAWHAAAISQRHATRIAEADARAARAEQLAQAAQLAMAR